MDPVNVRQVPVFMGVGGPDIVTVTRALGGWDCHRRKQAAIIRSSVVVKGRLQYRCITTFRKCSQQRPNPRLGILSSQKIIWLTKGTLNTPDDSVGVAAQNTAIGPVLAYITAGNISHTKSH